MSLHARKPDPIPEETARVARAAFPDGTLYVRMREELDVIYADHQPKRLSHVASAPHRLARAQASSSFILPIRHRIGKPKRPGEVRSSDGSERSRYLR